MRIDFSKIMVEDIEGNKSPYDVSKELGNMIYLNAVDIAEADLGREIYHKKEVDLTKEQADVVRGYVEKRFKAIAKMAILPLLSVG